MSGHYTFFPHCPSHQFALAPTPNAIFPRTEWMHKRCGHHAFIMANRYIHCDTLSRIVITATFARRFTSLGKYIIHKCIWMQSRIYYWQAIAKESRRAVGYLRWIQVIIVWVCVCGMHKICAFNSPTFKNTLCDRLPTAIMLCWVRWGAPRSGWRSHTQRSSWWTLWYRWLLLPSGKLAAGNYLCRSPAQPNKLCSAILMRKPWTSCE